MLSPAWIIFVVLFGVAVGTIAYLATDPEKALPPSIDRFWLRENWKEGDTFYQWGFLHPYEDLIRPRLYRNYGDVEERVSRASLHPATYEDFSSWVSIWKSEVRNGTVVPSERVAIFRNGRSEKLDPAAHHILAVGHRVSVPNTDQIERAHGVERHE